MFSNKISTVQKIVLSSSRGQGNFRGLEASRPRPRTSKSVLEDSSSVNYGYCFNRSLYSTICSGILIFENGKKVMHDITIGRYAVDIKIRFRIANQPNLNCAFCGSPLSLLNPIKLYSKIIYVFSTIQRLYY